MQEKSVKSVRSIKSVGEIQKKRHRSDVFVGAVKKGWCRCDHREGVYQSATRPIEGISKETC